MPHLRQSTGIAIGGFDALDQLQGGTENLLVGRLREYTGSGLRTKVENLHQVAIPAHSALAYRCRSHASPTEPRNARYRYPTAREDQTASLQTSSTSCRTSYRNMS